jgi:hypothetical protein
MKQGQGPAPASKIPVVTWATYGEFLAFATVLVLIPGPDCAALLGFSARLAAEHA